MNAWWHWYTLVEKIIIIGRVLSIRRTISTVKHWVKKKFGGNEHLWLYGMRDVTDTLWLENNNNPYSGAVWCIRQTMSTVKHCGTKLRCIYIYKHAALTTAQNSRRLILHVTTVVWNSGVNFTTEIWSWKYELLVWTMFRWGRISELKRTGRNDKITDTQIIICFQTVHLLDCILKYNETWNQQKTEIRNVAAETQRTTYWNSM